jgi:hypothetical protein
MHQTPTARQSLIWKTSVALLLAGFIWLFAADRLSWFSLTGNENLFRMPVYWLTGFSWDQYLASTYYEQWTRWMRQISVWTMVVGLVLALGGQKLPKLSISAIFLSGLLILGMQLMVSVDRGFTLVRLMEHSLQWATLFLFIPFWRRGEVGDGVRRLIRVCCALTFTGHGLFAMNALPVPVHFVEMTMTILHLPEAQARQFLIIAGILDILASIALFLPGRWQQTALYYMFLWGIMTTLARYAANVHLTMPWWPKMFLHWTPEVMIRVVHFMMPWYLIEQNRLTTNTK